MKSEHETVIDRAARLATPAVCSICRQVIDHPELRGKMFIPRPDGPDADKVPMSFSATLVERAGGIELLLKNWRIDERY